MDPLSKNVVVNERISDVLDMSAKSSLFVENDHVPKYFSPAEMGKERIEVLNDYDVESHKEEGKDVPLENWRRKRSCCS